MRTVCENDVIFHEAGGLLPKVPFRALVPRGSARITVAGRIVSAERVALAGIRAQCTCMAMGQAMGAAASLAVRRGVPSREVPGRDLGHSMLQPASSLATAMGAVRAIVTSRRHRMHRIGRDRHEGPQRGWIRPKKTSCLSGPSCPPCRSQPIGTQQSGRMDPTRAAGLTWPRNMISLSAVTSST